MELKDLGKTATDVSDIIHKMETTLTDTNVNEILGTMNAPPLPIHEILGLDKALQAIRGELTNKIAKLTELDEHIAKEKKKACAGKLLR